MFPYITEVIEKTPALYEFIAMQLRDIRMVSKIQHRERWSIDGLKKANLWVSRTEIIEYRKSIILILDQIFVTLEGEGCYIYPTESLEETEEEERVRKKHQRLICSVQAYCIGLIDLSCYGSRSQVMGRLKVCERVQTCDIHGNCADAEDSYHVNERVEWDLNTPEREKRPRSNKSTRFEEPTCVTAVLTKLIQLTTGLREERGDGTVLLPFVVRPSGLFFSQRKEFTSGEINKAIRFNNTTLGLSLPQPHVMRHLYCTHEYLNWYESKPGEDLRTFNTLIEHLAHDMNTSDAMVKENYLCCHYSTVQLHNSAERRRAAASINNLVGDNLTLRSSVFV